MRKKSTIGCITQTTLHVIYNVIMRSMEKMEKVFFGFSLDPSVQRSFERCHAMLQTLTYSVYLLIFKVYGDFIKNINHKKYDGSIFEILNV